MNYFNQVQQFIANNPQLILPIHATPASNALLAKLENELNIKFCSEYLRFIQNWGSVCLAGTVHNYFALYQYKEKTIYWVTDEAQYLWTTGLPRSYIPIVSDEGDEYYCLEPAVDGDQAVYAWDPFGSEFIRKQSDSLFELIWQDIVEHAIPNAKENGDIVHL